MTEQQQRNDRRMGGLHCPTCRLVQTHDRLFAVAAFGVVAGLGRKAKTNHEVYKGICLICNSLMQAKLLLGEPLDGIQELSSIIMRRQRNGPLGLCINANDDDDYSRRTEVSDITMDQNELMAVGGSGHSYLLDVGGNHRERDLQDILEEIFEEEDGQESGSSDENKSVNEGSQEPSQPELRLAHTRTRSNESLNRSRQSNDSNKHVRSQSDISHSAPGAQKVDQEDIYYTIFDRKKSGSYGEEKTEHTRNLGSQHEHEYEPTRSWSAPIPGAHQVMDKTRYSTIYDRKKSGTYGDKIAPNQDESSTKTRTDPLSPGAHKVDGESEYHTIYDRKKSGEYIRKSSINQEHSGMCDGPVSDCTKGGDLLDILKRESISASTILEVLERFNELKPDRDIDGIWLQALFSIMTSHTSNAKVQLQVFSTICSIISENEHCILDLELSEAQASGIIRVMEMHIAEESVQELLCNTIAGITVIEENALLLLKVCDGKAIQLLMDMLRIPSQEDTAQIYALKCLFHLLSAAPSDDHLDEVSRAFLKNGSLINSMVDCICKWPNSTSIEEEVGDILSKVAALYGEVGVCESLRAISIMISMAGGASNKLIESRSIAVEAMNQFQDSARVHEIACKVLATSYAIVSKEPIWNGIIAVEDLESINNSLSSHIHHLANVAASCAALHNFCALISLSAPSDTLGLDVLSKLANEVVNVFKHYQEHQQILEIASGTLYALCGLKDGLVTSETITLIVSAMNRFSDSTTLQQNGMGILWIFFSTSSKALDALNDEIVAATTRYIKETKEEGECDIAMGILLTLSSKGHQAEQIFLRNQHIIESIVECQFRWPNSFSIQGAAASILSNIAVYQTTRREICHMGGTSRVIAALNHLTRDPVFVCKAFDSLANLSSGADVEILRSEELPAPAILVKAMKRHPQNISVQVKGAHALRSLLAKDEHFKDEIVDLGGAEVITEAMAKFLGSVQMLTKGSVALWALAGSSKTTQDDRRKTRIGKCAIEPVVTGLSAHVAQGCMSREGISSEETCIAALGCLKCLSTTPTNKVIFEAAGALELIYSCLWQHYCNPQVCKDALAALCNISVRSTATNEVSEINDNQLEAVVLAMRTHQVGARAAMQSKQAERGVQENAIRLLRNSSFRLTNIVVLRQNPDISSLIRLAMPDLNGDCRNRANDLLCILQPIEAPIFSGLG